jgi:tetratricopeptide (TPR) repeat protein
MLRSCLALVLVVAALVDVTRADEAGLSGYDQPTWDRRDEEKSELHTLLQNAAVLHQDGEMEQAVKLLKQAIKLKPHGEAYATLSKVLADQGKYDLSDKAMVKATKLHNEQLASWSLF